MKKRNALILAVMLGITTTGAVMKINQAPTKRSSAPGEQTCGGCHAGNVNTGSGTVSLSVPTEYLPGTIYVLTHDITDNGFTSPRYGFTTTSLDQGGNQAGSFTLLNTANTSLQTDLVNGQLREYVGHRAANVTKTWDYQWTAPATPSGDVIFYAVSVYANRNNGISGDRVYIDTFTVPLAASYPQPSFASSSPTICSGDTVQFSNTTTGTITTYSWDFGNGAVPATSSLETPPSVSYSNPGTKTIQLTVTGPDGTESTSQTIVVNENPSVNILLTQAKFCEGSGGVLVQSQTTGGTPGYSYSWTCENPAICGISNPQNANPILNPAILPLSDTLTYTLTAVDANGCQADSDSIDLLMLPAPIVDAGPDLFRCPLGPSVVIQGSVIPDSTVAGPFTYQWIPSDGLNDPSSLSPFAAPDTTTTYRLQATDLNGCANLLTNPAAQMTVMVEELIEAEAGIDQVICAGDSIQLSGSASGGTFGTTYSYQWVGDTTISNPFQASTSVFPSMSTTYTLSVTGGATGCAGNPDTVRVFISELPLVDVGADIALCEGDSTVLNAQIVGEDPRYDLSWIGPGFVNDPTISNPTVTSDTSGQMILTVTSTAGCGSLSDSLTLSILPSPIPVISGTDTLSSTSATAYQWYFTDSVGGNLVAIPGAIDQDLFVRDTLLTSITNTGFIVVEVMYANGCMEQSSPFDVPILISAEEELWNDVQIFPNPTAGQLTIQIIGQENRDLTLRLIDLQGKQIDQTFLSPVNRDARFDLQHLSAGMYLLQMSDGNQSTSRKILKK